MNYRLPITLIFAFTLFVLSCGDSIDENPPPSSVNFDRAEMLEFLADDVIIPTYVAYTTSVSNLTSETTSFFEQPSIDNLTELRAAWLDAYLAWQDASLFEIGMAEELGLRNFTNIYPTNVELIQENINSGTYNLELPSNFAAQGYPALDYLLFGLRGTDAEIVEALSTNEVETYITDLVNRLDQLGSSVLEDWNQGFRDAFIANSGSSATASTDKLVNDFLFYYERFLRAAKVGIPAGRFSVNEQPDLVEGLYSEIYSKQLFERAFSSVRAFFNGQSFDELRRGPSLEQYLTEVMESNNNLTVNIGSQINAQWDNVDIALDNVGDNFRSQVIEDNSRMLALYDEIQGAIVPLKVDMLSALNIQVDFVDADGD